jgi:hypothetical protein
MAMCENSGQKVPKSEAVNKEFLFDHRTTAESKKQTEYDKDGIVQRVDRSIVDRKTHNAYPSVSVMAKFSEKELKEIDLLVKIGAGKNRGDFLRIVARTYIDSFDEKRIEGLVRSALLKQLKIFDGGDDQ